jgi:hypothetical protein
MAIVSCQMTASKKSLSGGGLADSGQFTTATECDLMKDDGACTIVQNDKLWHQSLCFHQKAWVS